MNWRGCKLVLGLKFFRDIDLNTLRYPVMFIGDGDTGKFELALRLTLRLLVGDLEDVEFASSLFKGYESLFLVWPKGGKIGIDFVREVKNFDLMQRGGVCIIKEAEFMTVEAANALLKVLEESENTKFVLTVTDEGKVLDTIKSRCYRVRLASESFSFLERFSNSLVNTGFSILTVAPDISKFSETVVGIVDYLDAADRIVRELLKKAISGVENGVLLYDQFLKELDKYVELVFESIPGELEEYFEAERKYFPLRLKNALYAVLVEEKNGYLPRFSLESYNADLKILGLLTE